MSRHFIPQNVRDKFYVKLQGLKQYDKMCVDEYIKKFKLFVISSDIGDSENGRLRDSSVGLSVRLLKD